MPKHAERETDTRAAEWYTRGTKSIQKLETESMRNLLFALTLAALALGSHSLAAAEKLALGSLFSDHGVLQRDMAVPVWGQAEPGTKVVVQFAGQEKQGAAD